MHRKGVFGRTCQQCLNHSEGQMKELNQEFLCFRKNHMVLDLLHNEGQFYPQYLNDFKVNLNWHFRSIILQI